jgi:hypothetical protein
VIFVKFPGWPHACNFGLFQAHPMCCAALFFSQSSDLQLMPSFSLSLSKEKKDTIYLFHDRPLSPVMTLNKLVAALVRTMRSKSIKKKMVHKWDRKMEHYLNWPGTSFSLSMGLHLAFGSHLLLPHRQTWPPTRQHR